MGIAVRTRTKVKMEHRIDFPFLLQLFHGKSLKKVFPSQVITLQRGDKNAFSETSWSSQKINASLMSERIYQRRLIYIDISTLTELLKILYSYRIFHIVCLFD